MICFHKSKSQLVPVRNQKRHQCCTNPRVKGVNTRREFHAWQVCHMVPVFPMFTHANEHHAYEQTSAPPTYCTALTENMPVWLHYPLTGPSCVLFLMNFQAIDAFPCTSKIFVMCFQKSSLCLAAVANFTSKLFPSLPRDSS